jgi:hypothetical protein
MSKSKTNKEWHEERIANLKKGVDHYRSRLDETLDAQVKLKYKLAKKEEELKMAQESWVKGGICATLISSEEEESMNKRMAEDHKRRRDNG